MSDTKSARGSVFILDNGSERGESNSDKEDPMDILNLLKIPTVPFDKKVVANLLPTLKINNGTSFFHLEATENGY